MEQSLYAQSPSGLTREEISAAVLRSIEGRTPRRALILPPDFTRLHSGAGEIANLYYHALRDRGCRVDVMPALGTHDPVTREQAAIMFGDIPYEAFIPHHWRTDVVTLGEIPASYLTEITGGLWNEPLCVQINRRVMDPAYDLIVSVGQVLPHEVAGMSNHAKNLFVGVGGSEMINQCHMVGAVYGLERMMGKDHSPVRKLFDYGMAHFLRGRPVLFALTVATAPEGATRLHGLFLGWDRRCLEAAVRLAQEKNINFVPRGIQKCVVYLDPAEYQSTWLGNKAVYRTRMALADGGQLIVLAPGVCRFGEDRRVDELIRKYGYRGRLRTLEQFERPENQDLRDNMSAAAHLIHGSPDGRFEVVYAVKQLPQSAVEGVGYRAADYDEMARKYNPRTLRYGYNDLPGGEKVFFIPNPGLGLWIDEERFS